MFGNLCFSSFGNRCGCGGFERGCERRCQKSISCIDFFILIAILALFFGPLGFVFILFLVLLLILLLISGCLC